MLDITDRLVELIPNVINKKNLLKKELVEQSIGKISQIAASKGVETLYKVVPDAVLDGTLKELFAEEEAQTTVDTIAAGNTPPKSSLDFDGITSEIPANLRQEIHKIITKEKRIPSKNKVDKTSKEIVAKAILLGRQRGSILMKKSVDMGILDGSIITDKMKFVPVISHNNKQSLNQVGITILNGTMKVMKELLKATSNGAKFATNKSYDFAKGTDKDSILIGYKAALMLMAAGGYLIGFCDLLVPFLDWWYPSSDKTADGNDQFKVQVGRFQVTCSQEDAK